MKMFCISHDKDVNVGMRLAGIEGILVDSEKNNVEKILDEIVKDEKIAIVLITEKLADLCEEKMINIKKNLKIPVIVRIPNREGDSKISDTIAKYIHESVGIKIWNWKRVIFYYVLRWKKISNL